jgi:hypothetical protein
VLGGAPQRYEQNITILGTLSCTGLESVMTFEGVTDSDVFRTDAHEILCPTLCVGDIVIVDNFSALKAASVQKAITPRGHGCSTCHRTRPTRTRSSAAGQSSRHTWGR